MAARPEIPAIILELNRKFKAELAASGGRGFYDEMVMSEAERAEEAERLRKDAMEKARAPGLPADEKLRLERLARIIDFDPKQDGDYYNRLGAVDLAKLDLDEESPLRPMRYTDRDYGSSTVDLSDEGLNILSVKIASSDVGFPIQVYGKVIARDYLDRKCLYLFRRDRDHPQLINSEVKSLILTGPKRGLALLGSGYVEIDLKIKNHQGQDKELSKGYVTIRGIGRSFEKCTIESRSLATRLSTVDVMYAVVKHAVEATIEVEVLRGRFFGEIIAHTDIMKDMLVVYRSTLSGRRQYCSGVIQLTRPVVCVCMKDKLMLSITASIPRTIYDTINFTPSVNGAAQARITVGVCEMRVKVVWSLMD